MKYSFFPKSIKVACLFSRGSLSSCLLVGILFTFLSFFVLSADAHAENPKKVLKEIISKIKSASNTSPVVDYVNWSKAYGSLSESRKNFMGIDSPDSMKEYYRRVLKSPVSVMKEQFERKLESVPNNQRPALEQTFARMEKVMAQKSKEMESRVKNTDYEIGEVKIEGETATIALKHTFNSVFKTEEVILERVGDKWLLPSVGMIANRPSAK